MYWITTVSHWIGTWGLIQSIFYALFFIIKSHTSQGRLTSFLFTIVSLELLLKLIFSSASVTDLNFKWVYLFSDVVTISAPLFILYYIKRIIDIKDNSLHYLRWLVLFIPIHFVIFTLFHQTHEQVYITYKSALWRLIENKLFYLVSSIPLFISFRLLLRYKNPQIRFHFWLYIYVLFHVVTRVFIIIDSNIIDFLDYFAQLKPSGIYFDNVIEICALSVMSAITGMYVFFESPYFIDQSALSSTIEAPVLVAKKFNLKEEEITSISNKIDNALKQKEWVKNPNLTEALFAEYINVPKHQVSLVINNHFNTSFKELINSVRIQTLIELKKSKEFENYSLFGLAQLCGYKAESTFITNFKKHTGMLPNEYFKMENETKQIEKN